jgi:uncharacterized protein (UPF0216 family)
MNVREMKEWLEQFDDELPVVLNIEDANTNSGVYISVCSESKVEKIIFEDEQVEENLLVLTPCQCHIDGKLQPNTESINPN